MAEGKANINAYHFYSNMSYYKVEKETNTDFFYFFSHAKLRIQPIYIRLV